LPNVAEPIQSKQSLLVLYLIIDASVSDGLLCSAGFLLGKSLGQKVY